MILEYGNVTYEDLSVMQFFGCPWHDAKAKTPFSQLPIIVVDTEVVGQSGAISRYCSRLVPSVLPTDSLAIARCDAIYDTAAELNSINPLVNVYRGKEQRAKLTTFLEETFKPKLASLDRVLPESGGPFCFGVCLLVSIACTLVFLACSPRGRGIETVLHRRPPCTATLTCTTTWTRRACAHPRALTHTQRCCVSWPRSRPCPKCKST